MKPNFLIIGAMKCATTSLSELFAEHPQIFVCTPKEPDLYCTAPSQTNGIALDA